MPIGKSNESTEISIRGIFKKVPAVTLDALTIAITGKLVRTGFIRGEGWLDPSQIEKPEWIIEKLREIKAPLDIFTFHQPLPESQPRYRYPYEWDNIAIIPLISYADWWEHRASQVTRKNVRRSAKRGVDVRSIDFDDQLIKSIVRVNNDAPFRTGRKFWHYGKDFDAVKKDYSSYLDRSEFLGAFHRGELIGFLRLVYQGDVANIMQLLSMKTHYDKRPSNALMAKAVEICTEIGKRYLIYGKYVYDDYTDNPLTEFKRRNGFEKTNIPVYYVPMTLKGRIALRLNIHAGILRLIPKRLRDAGRALRTKLQARHRKQSSDADSESE